MILEEIRVENWRNYMGEHIFKFEEGVNLITGSNGSGKTTLFEVLWRTFFDRHNTASADMQEIRPVGTTLSPRSSIIFRHAGRKYKIEKQFLDHQYARLYEWQGNGFSLLHEQDKADSVISELLSGTLTGSGTTKPKNRGIAEALWYLQKDKSVPEGKWNEGLQKGFGGIIDIAVESPKESRILELIDRDYSDNLTESKGEPKKSTELYEVIEKLKSKKTELEGLQSKLQSADRLRDELEQKRLDEIDKNNALTAADSEKKKSEQEITETYSFERRKIQTKGEYDKVTQKADELKKELDEINDRNQEISDLRRKVGEWNSQFLYRQTKSSTARSEREEHETKWQSELQPKLKAVESHLEALETLEKMNNLNKDKVDLETFLSKLKSKEEEFSAKKKALAILIAPSEIELKTFRNLNVELTKVESKLSVNSIRVGFKLKEGISVVPEGKISNVKGEFIVTEPSTFIIKNVGTVKVRGGTESLKELNESKIKLEKSRSDLLQKYSVKDETSLNKLRYQRDSLEREVKRIEKEVSDLAKERPNAEDDLAQVKRDIITTQRKMKGLQLPSIEGSDIKSQIEVLGKEKEGLNKEIEDTQSKEKEAFKRYERENQKASDFKSRIDVANTRISTLENENGRAIASFGNLQILKKELLEAEKSQEELKKELADLDKLYNEKVTEPRRRAEIIDKTLKGINERLVQVGKEIVRLESQIEQIADEGIYTNVSDLEIEIEGLDSRRIVLERRANARRLLRELINLFKIQRALAIGAPIHKYVDPWLEQLTGGAFVSVSVNEFLQPDSAILSDHTNRISLASLSYGTAEQVIVLIRLAIALILSQKERNLIVLDDRLVNADPVRLQRMLSIIDEVSKNCQIIISSCEDTRYLGVATNVIRLPSYKAKE